MTSRINQLNFHINNNRTWDSKWFSKNNYKYNLIEDLNIRKIVNNVFESSNKINNVVIIDKCVLYKYQNNYKLYIYVFFSNKFFQQNTLYNYKYNISDVKGKLYKNYKLNSLKKLLYTNYINSKKLECIRLIKNLIPSDSNIQILVKDIGLTNNPIKHNVLTTRSRLEIQKLLKRYKKVKYYKTLNMLFLSLAFSKYFKNYYINANTLCQFIKNQLLLMNEGKKDYKFNFYTLLNLINVLGLYYTNLSNSNFKGLKLHIKGRFLLNKRKRVIILNIGKIPLNTLDINIDYSHKQITKTSGTSSIKLWINNTK